MIRTEDRGALRVVKLDRPDKANALTETMLGALCEAAEAATEAARADVGARALVLTGAGAVFSAGMDLEAARAGLGRSPLWERLSGAIAAHPGLTIAAMNGTLAGGAMGMALACDLRLAVPGAKLFYPVMTMGFLPQPSDPGRLRALVGPARAKRLLMAAEKITVEDGRDWGLIDRIVPRDDLLDVAAELAAPVIEADAAHAFAIKTLIGKA
ncbi:putative enoyl-CoA hydratase echA6 [Roseivivax jejudonensis]|uniref:Putative enoyl-CoA hydratase echA6 n=1 Tax=Roseivivax jejudonensis TaxID=1529041 RepID=A0A1X6YH17_9RHOB|nr:enoyl-CoA hydratase/isomerase family protein [Roseivivax jejudonensis]SLN21199.1 putative enoyl-CoA hydratase echA6 [Roseivivax jejudonensis]